MNLSSLSFANGGSIPSRYTADGDNHSPPLFFNAVPANARSLVLTMEDDDAPHGPFAHWVMFDLEPHLSGLAQAEIAGRYRDGVNGFRELGYTGPHARDRHRYVFRLYALDTLLGLPNGTELRQLKQAMAGHLLETAELTGTYHCTAEFPSAPLSRTKAPLAAPQQ
jgi:Raf kinase inhibitor-like YbhB/YbcL family protein